MAIGIQIPSFQKKAVDFSTKILKETTGLDVSVGHVSIDYFSKFHLSDVLLKDYKSDTMIYVRDIQHDYALKWIRSPRQLNSKDISLKGVRVYLDNTRSDSVLNLTKTFRKNKTNKTDTVNKSQPKSATKSSDILTLGHVQLEDVEFRFLDRYNYKRIKVGVENICIDAQNFSLRDSLWNIRELTIERPLVRFVDEPKPWTPKNLNPEYLSLPFQITVERLALHQGRFSLRDEAVTPHRKSKNELLFTDLDVSNININAEDVKLRKPSIQANVRHFAASEKSGFRIKELRTQFFMNSWRTEGRNLFFQTDNSRLEGNLKFRYGHMREYLRFAKLVRVDSKLKNSFLDVRDLAYFSPSLRPFEHLQVQFSTEGSGRMNQLQLRNLNAGIHDNRIRLQSNMLISDLFIPGKLRINAQMNHLEFDKKDAEFIFKKPLPNEVSNMGKVKYIGRFEGDPMNFVLNGKLLSSKGNINFKNSHLDIRNVNNPHYDGNIGIEDFRLAEVIPSMNIIDNIHADLRLDGNGFDIDRFHSKLKGKIQSIKINHTTYTNIDVDGHIENRIFQGNVNSLDPDLKILAKGEVSWVDKNQPQYRLSLNLQDIDMQKLKLTSKNFSYNADIEVAGKGKTLDDMTGSMIVRNMYVMDRNLNTPKRLDYSVLTVDKEIEEDNQMLEINSEEITANLVGKYRLQDIPSLMSDYLISYLSIEDNDKAQSYSNTYFYLKSDLKNIGNYTRLFYDDLKNIERGNITMRFDGTSSRLKVDGELYHTQWLQFQIPKITIDNASTMSAIESNLNFDSVYFQNKLAITPLKAKITNVGNNLKLAVELLERQDSKFVDFNTIISKSGDLYSFNILPFTSYFGRKVWTVNPDNRVDLNPITRSLYIENLNLKKDIQDIKIESRGEDKLLGINFKNVKLEEIISGFLPILKTFKGNLNGTIDIANPMTNPTPITNVSVKSIEIDDEKIGDLGLQSSMSENILRTDLNIVGDRVKLSADAIYDASKGIDSLYSRVKIQRLDLSFLNKYLKELVYKMEGNIHADLKFYGKMDRLQAEGDAHIDSMATNIQTIKTRYTARNQDIHITPGRIALKDFKFYDEYNNQATAYGYISHDNLRNFDLNLNATAPKLFCLNTTSNDNSYFYGRVFADAEINFRGIIGERIRLYAKGRNLPNTNATIAFGSSQRTDRYGFYEFIDKSKTVNGTQQTARTKKGGVDLNFDFDINNLGRLTIVMDPAVDDKIECTGDGSISYRMTPESDMDIKGTYTINSGYYKFTYQNLIQRTFYLNKGGSMTFVGNPRASTINASAVFKARANAQDLISAYYGTNNSSVATAAKTPIKVDITLYLKDKITQPTISYALTTEQNNPEIQAAFETIQTVTKNNPNELSNQVMGILVFNRFLTPSFTGFSSTNSGSNAGNDAANVAADIISGKVSGYLTDFIQNTIQGMSVDFNLRNYNQFEKSNNTSNVRRNLNLALSQKLLNDRLVFNLGGNYDFGQDLNQRNTSYFGGDIDFEYKLTPLGNVRLRVYSTFNNDPLNSKYINKTGAGIVFQRDFESFDKIFKTTKKIDK